MTTFRVAARALTIVLYVSLDGCDLGVGILFLFSSNRAGLRKIAEGIPLPAALRPEPVRTLSPPGMRLTHEMLRSAARSILPAFHHFRMNECGEVELARVWLAMPEIRAKQQRKPHGSPLTGAVRPDRPEAGHGDRIKSAVHRLEIAALDEK